jgi:glycosyltransferase involved in cell wall biosynthesis
MSLPLGPDAPASSEQPPPDFTRGERSGRLITIGIPCYNRPALLAEALASIAAQREYADFEVVVCDDGGLPETRRVVAESAVPTIRLYVNRPALGPVRNWNRCIELAAGRWVTILHEDDLLYPWFLQAVTRRLRNEVAAVAVKCVQGRTPPALAEPARKPRVVLYPPMWFLKAAMTPFPGVVFRRDVALRLGGFNPQEGGLADYAFWYELARGGPVETLRTPAAFYRVNEGQWTEREWPTMLRRAHRLRLRIAREQFGPRSRVGRWIARFYTSRMARAYSRRFPEAPAVLSRARQFEKIPFSRLPSGWVWAFLKLRARLRN